MKLFWKVFLSTMFTALLAFSTGGFFLIDSQFRDSLAQEIARALQETELLCRSLEREASMLEEALSLKGLLPSQLGQAERDFRVTLLREAVQTVEANFPSSAFSVYNEKKSPLRGEWKASPLLSRLSSPAKGYLLAESQGMPTLYAVAPLRLDEELYYLEASFPVSQLFVARETQYQTYSLLALAMAVACGGMSLLLSQWLTSPVRKLSQAARKAAKGDLSQRVPARSQDELGVLSADFNHMVQELESSIGELKTEVRRKEDFMASFAHELKTPLTSIIGYADLMRSQPMEEEDVFSASQYIFSEGKRLEALAMKLLELFVAGNRNFTLRSMDAAAFLRKTAELARPGLERAQIILSVSAEPAALSIEPDLMQTACLNLLDNARKAVAPGGHILFFGRCCENGYAIAVRDTGRGMSPEELSRITEPFYMVEKSRARSQGGAGLGLALCQKIVELHGGELRFHSRPGEGTLACILLRSTPPAPEQPASRPAEQKEGRARRKERL